MEKNFEGKIGESDILEIPVKDPRTTSTIANYINVILDFINFNPPYWLRSDNDTGEGHWWYYFKQNNTVHVLIAEDVRKGFVNLMTRKNNNENLTREEIGSLETYAAILNTTPHIGAQQATDTYPEYILGKITNPENTKKTNRTKKKAGEIDEVPTVIPTITNKKYQNAMTLNTDSTAYLQPFSSVDNLVYENGQILFKGLPASAATLKEYFTSTEIDNFDLPLLRLFYGIILNRFAKTWKEDQSIEGYVTIYYPDLAKKLGKSSNISKSDVQSCIDSIMQFQTIMGIIDNGSKGTEIIPVLVYMGNDTEKNTISFASPYMVKVIKNVFNASIRKNKTGLPQLKKDGNPQLLPAYSYMIKSSIGKERNKKAVEIVFVIVSLIEQSGNHCPHIKAKTIIDRIPILKNSIDNCKTTSDKNKMLKRAFSKAWDILPKHTKLKETYQDIKLPLSTDVPSMSSLDIVYKFPHNGKTKS